MKKFIEFMKKPRNLYLSIALMLVVVVGLSSITFSYYIEDSTNASQVMKVSKNNTFIQTDDLDSDELTLPPNTFKAITINVINNNDFDSIYKLYYIGDGVDIIINEPIVNALKPKDVLTYTLTFNNPTDELKVVKLGIVTGYKGNSIDVPEGSRQIK